MSQATIEAEGARQSFGATMALAGIDIHTDAARGTRPTRAWKEVLP
jgi:hypothetical protein